MVKELLTHLHEEIEFSAQMVCFAEEKGFSLQRREMRRVGTQFCMKCVGLSRVKTILILLKNCSSFGKLVVAANALDPFEKATNVGQRRESNTLHIFCILDILGLASLST